jgi:hypothetical protein
LFFGGFSGELAVIPKSTGNGQGELVAATVAVGLGATVGVGEVAAGDGVGVGLATGVGVGEVAGLADGAGVGDGFGVGEGFAPIAIAGAPRKRQAIKQRNRDVIWRLFFDEVFTII